MQKVSLSLALLTGSQDGLGLEVWERRAEQAAEISSLLFINTAVRLDGAPKL